MKKTLIILATLFSIGAYSQTKKIAHKSHSGSDANFIAANYLDNLGDPPMMFVDKIVKINDTTALQYCSRFRGTYSRKDTIKYYDDFYETDSVKIIDDTIAIKFSSGYLKKNKKTDTIISDKNKLHHVLLREETYNPYVKKDYKNVEFVGFKDSLENLDIDSATKKEVVPIIKNSNSSQTHRKNYNENALKNFMLIAFLLIVFSGISIVFLFKKKHYA